MYSQDSSYTGNYVLGETKVGFALQCFSPCNSKVLFVNLHENEKTSIQAAELYLLQNGGKLLKLVNKGQRFITFNQKKKTYWFDPNRIFSPAGIDSTLKLLSYRPAATGAEEVRYFSDQLLITFIDSSSLIIALHNNMDSLLSVNSYLEDQNLQKHFGAVHINPDLDPDDFILTTDSTLFNRIREKNLNVVYENGASVSDDGSLSVYAALHKIPYINVEAQHDHCDEQLAMLQALDEIIKEYDKEKTAEEVIAIEPLAF